MTVPAYDFRHTLPADFADNTVFRPAPACWDWVDRVSRWGFGLCSDGKTTAHRYSFKLHMGRFPKPGQTLYHRCKNSLCVNPEHFKLSPEKHWVGYPELERFAVTTPQGDLVQITFKDFTCVAAQKPLRWCVDQTRVDLRHAFKEARFRAAPWVDKERIGPAEKRYREA